MADVTTYVPTRSNLAHAAAKRVRKGLAEAVRAGFDASDLSDEELQDAIGGTEGAARKLGSVGELSLEHAMLAARAMDGAGFAAFSAAVKDAIDAEDPTAE